MPASFPWPFPILMGNRRWPSSTGLSFPGLVRRKPSANRRPARWISIARASGFPTVRWARPATSPITSATLTLHNRLASPVAPGSALKIGGGTPPILTRHGWMVIYHGVHELAEPSAAAHKLCYSAGVLVLSREHPRVILYRSPEPVLTPELPQECIGTVANVVFPTAIDRRDDLGMPDRFDVYYGMADNRIGVARLDVPESLPPGALADPPRVRGLASRSTVNLQQRVVAGSRSRSTEVHRHHDTLSHHRPARTGRTLRQHAALPGRGRRAEGQVRAPRSASGFGGHGLRTLGSLAQVQPA